MRGGLCSEVYVTRSNKEEVLVCSLCSEACLCREVFAGFNVHQVILRDGDLMLDPKPNGKNQTGVNAAFSRKITLMTILVS